MHEESGYFPTAVHVCTYIFVVTRDDQTSHALWSSLIIAQWELGLCQISGKHKDKKKR